MKRRSLIISSATHGFNHTNSGHSCPTLRLLFSISHLLSSSVAALSPSFKEECRLWLLSHGQLYAVYWLGHCGISGRDESSKKLHRFRHRDPKYMYPILAPSSKGRLAFDSASLLPSPRH